MSEMKIGKDVVLLLEYNMGDYSEMEEKGQDIPTAPNDIGLQECFYQGDIDIQDMKIVGVKIKEYEKYQK